VFSEIMHEVWGNYRGRLIGVIIGLVIGLLFLFMGFFRTIFLLLCISAGFFIGNRVDNKEELIDLLDRLLPPGYHR